jgi:DNA-directed RNA polymerase specialized sigma24 family protein
LPAEQRRTIELAYFGSRSFSEVARIMNVSVGTAKSRARLAMRRLRRNAQLRIAYHGDQMRAVPSAVAVPAQEAS